MPRYVCTATVPSPTLGLIQPGDIVNDVSNIDVLKKDGQLQYFRKMEDPPKPAKVKAKEADTITPAGTEGQTGAPPANDPPPTDPILPAGDETPKA